MKVDKVVNSFKVCSDHPSQASLSMNEALRDTNWTSPSPRGLKTHYQGLLVLSFPR